MLNRPCQCVITGITLRCPDLYDGHANGDLFSFGDFFIFNGNPQPLRQGQYTYPMEVEVPDPSQYFSRREVYIFPKAAAVLNEAARECLEKSEARNA